MAETYRIPIGSQHIALLEPLRFELFTENEHVVDVLADVGYVHRGVEKACASRFNFKQVPYVVARVCGICAVTHSTVYTQAVEKLINVEISRRAMYLRMLALEIDRLHSHLLCLGHTAENSGFEALFMAGMRDREKVMEMHEILSGNRVQVDYTCLGGVNRDITPEVAAGLSSRIKELRERAKVYVEIFTTNPTLSLKFKGVAQLSKERAYALNAVGPMARAAGIEYDVRNEPSNLLPYKEIGYQIVTEAAGDVHARNVVRLREFVNSLDMVENILANIPEGEIKVRAPGRPEGEAVMRLEAPRGELAYYIKGNGKQILERVKIKTPTFSNIPAMVELFKGQEYANVPGILASYDPCLSCTAR